MSKSIVTWQDPPLGRRRIQPWFEIAQALRDNPGRWALVVANGHAVDARNIASGRLVAFRPAGSFEATTRVLPNTRPRRSNIFARFVGEGGE